MSKARQNTLIIRYDTSVSAKEHFVDICSRHYLNNDCCSYFTVARGGFLKFIEILFRIK